MSKSIIQETRSPDERKLVPDISSELRSDLIRVPQAIAECSGIRIFGRRIKSILFSTDVAIILNTNADAVLAVYPFTPHPAIIQSITSVSQVPVLAGVGGGTTQGSRCAQIAMFAEALGCSGVVVNAPTPNTTIRMINEIVDVQNIDTCLDTGINILVG